MKFSEQSVLNAQAHLLELKTKIHEIIREETNSNYEIEIKDIYPKEKWVQFWVWYYDKKTNEKYYFCFENLMWEDIND